MRNINKPGGFYNLAYFNYDNSKDKRRLSNNNFEKRNKIRGTFYYKKD